MKLFHCTPPVLKPSSGVNPVPSFALINRDSFVIQPHGGCRSDGCDRKISVVIRGQG